MIFPICQTFYVKKFDFSDFFIYNYSMTIEEIKIYMKKNKITQLQLSEKAKIPIGTIRDIFRGATQHPRIDTMKAIEDALGLNEKAVEEKPPQSIEDLINHLKGLPQEKQQELAPVIEHLINAIKK